MSYDKEVDLLSYLPPYLQEYQELQALTTAENPEFKLLWDIYADLRSQLFVTTATQKGLARFEQLLGIYPTPQDTIESRRTRILMLWNDSMPYTFKVLIQMLKQFNFSSVAIDYNNYKLYINTAIGFFGGVRNLEYILENVVPANLVVISTNMLDYSPEKRVFAGATVTNILRYEM